VTRRTLYTHVHHSTSQYLNSSSSLSLQQHLKVQLCGCSNPFKLCKLSLQTEPLLLLCRLLLSRGGWVNQNVRLLQQTRKW
jgi:hypothetical protein